MNRAGALTILTIPSMVAALALADGLMEQDEDAAALQEEYTNEQARIDLEISRFQLEAARWRITEEEAQAGIDQWLSSNSQRLEEQADRAALLDDLNPPPPTEEEQTPSGGGVVPEDSPHAARYAELAAAWDFKIQELRALAENPEHLQGLIDSYMHSPEGQALRQEKGEIEQEEAGLRPLGTQPVVLEVDEDAPPAAVAALEVQERMARRIMDIRERNPQATPEEMQTLIDARMGEFRQDFAEISPLLEQASRDTLEADVVRLQAEASDQSPVEGNPPAGGQ